MPIGKVNEDLNITGDTFKDGTPITIPHEFGTPVNLPHEFGNVEPVSDATLYSNPVTWPTPNPAHFGNINPNGTPIPVQAATPTFSPVAGSYGPTQNVSISSTTSGAAIYYTTNGVDPTTGDTLYSGPVSVAVSETLKAIAVAAGFTNSAVGSAAYVINGQVATPTFSPVAGTYTGTQNVTVSSTTSGATFYYTTDGSDPTTSSTLYSGPISVSSSETLKVLAVKSGFTDSAIGSAVYAIYLFYSDFPDAGSWPPADTTSTFVAGLGGVWTAPNDIQFSGSDDRQFGPVLGSSVNGVSIEIKLGVGVPFFGVSFADNTALDNDYQMYASPSTGVQIETTIAGSLYSSPIYPFSAGSVVTVNIYKSGSTVAVDVLNNGVLVAQGVDNTPQDMSTWNFPNFDLYIDDGTTADYGSARISQYP